MVVVKECMIDKDSNINIQLFNNTGAPNYSSINYMISGSGQ